MVNRMGYYDDYLEHHGIRGQKWGLRRFQNKDGSLTPKGKKRYEDSPSENKTSNPKNPTSNEPEKKGLSDKQKKALVTGAAIAGTVLAAYGGYKLHQLNKEATEGLRKKYSYEFKNVQSKANEKKLSVSQWQNVADRARELGKMDTFNTSMYYANKNRSSARELQSQADALQALINKNKYSMKEKVKYLKNK